MNTKAELRIPSRSLKGLATKHYMEWWTMQSNSLPKGDNEFLMEQPKLKSQIKAQSRKRKEDAFSRPKPGTNEARRIFKKAKNINEVNPLSLKSKPKGINKAPAEETTRTNERNEGSKEAPPKTKECKNDKTPASKNTIQLKVGTAKLPSIVVKGPTPNKDEGQAKSVLNLEDEVSSSREDRHWKRLRKKASISNLDKADCDVDRDRKSTRLNSSH